MKHVLTFSALIENRMLNCSFKNSLFLINSPFTAVESFGDAWYIEGFIAEKANHFISLFFCQELSNLPLFLVDNVSIIANMVLIAGTCEVVFNQTNE